MSDTSTSTGSEAVARQSTGDRRGGWPAVLSLALGSFALVLSEFLPIGLLPAVAADLGIGVGTAGLLVFGTGVAAAVSAPVIAVLVSGTDRRTVVLWLTVLLVVADVLGALADDFTTLLASRVLLGVGVGGFWAIGAGLARRLVADGEVIRATSSITAGISIATVLSLPLGSLVSAVSTWRAALVIGAVVGAVALVAQLALLPRIPAEERVRVSTLKALLMTSRARTVLIACVFVFVAQFAAYTYVAHYLTQLVHLDAGLVTVGLLILGVAGIVGNSLASFTLARNLLGTVIGVQVLLVMVVVLLPLLAWSLPSVVVLLVLWGLVWGALPLGMQTWMLQATPSATEGSLALFVTTVQLSIAAGSFVGGLAVGALGLRSDFFLAGGIAAIGVVVILSLTRYRRATAVGG